MCGCTPPPVTLWLLGAALVFTGALANAVTAKLCQPSLADDGSTRQGWAGVALVFLWPVMVAAYVAGSFMVMTAMLSFFCPRSIGHFVDPLGKFFKHEEHEEERVKRELTVPGRLVKETTSLTSGRETKSPLSCIDCTRRWRLPLIFCATFGWALLLAFVISWVDTATFFEPIMPHVASAQGYLWRPTLEESLRKEVTCDGDGLFPARDCLHGEVAKTRDSTEDVCRRVPTPSPHMNPASDINPDALNLRCSCNTFFGNGTHASNGEPWGDEEDVAGFVTTDSCRDHRLVPPEEGVHTSDTPVNHPRVTFVTSFVGVGKAGESNDDCYYLKPYVQWAQLSINLAIFASPEALRPLQRVREHYGQGSRTVGYALHDWSDVPFGEKLPQIRENVLRNLWKSAMTGFYRGRDMLIPEYTLINHAKVGFLRRAVLNNTFGSDFFFWVDSGAGYDEVAFRGPVWCPCSATVRDAVTFASNDFVAVHDFNEQSYWGNSDGSEGLDCSPSCGYWSHGYYKASPVGGMWGGASAKLLDFHELYKELFDTMTDRLRLVDVDQPLFALAYNRQPGYLRLIHNPGVGRAAFYPYRGFC